MKKFIGFYRACDFVTMLGCFMALLGCILAINGSKLIPIFCLVLAGICDAFDGVLARKGKFVNEQSVYGRELDSLSDMISFGLFPLVLTVCNLPSNSYFAWVCIIFYTLCGMIRLAYFNMMDICEISDKKYFVGVPITFISICYPIVYLICYYFDFKYFNIIAPLFFMLVGLSFIYRVKIRKLTNNDKIILCLVAGVLVIVLIILKIFGLY